MTIGRSKRQTGAHAINNAEDLFRRSVEAGKPNYAHVARAIGAAPHAPPAWAIWACIELRQREEPTTARGHATNLSDVLDDIVRHFDREQRDFEQAVAGNRSMLDAYRPPSLRSAILHVLEVNGLRQENVGSANDDWFRDIREAWEWEQENDLAPTSPMIFEEGSVSDINRRLKTTSRIHRVLMESIAAELGHPKDVAVWAWVTKCLIEAEVITSQAQHQTEK